MKSFSSVLWHINFYLDWAENPPPTLPPSLCKLYPIKTEPSLRSAVEQLITTTFKPSTALRKNTQTQQQWELVVQSTSTAMRKVVI